MELKIRDETSLRIQGRSHPVLLIFSPAGMDRFFDEAAERRMPLQAVPTDPMVLKELATFTEKYGYEFAEFRPGP
jgi:hypothetical protein